MLPLQDFRILTIAVNIPGPVAAGQLAGLGAVVTKVEPPGGDLLAVAAPAWYKALHSRQQVVRLDLKTAEGQAGLHRLLSDSDLLLSSTRPAALERLGLGWGTLAARYPRLCQVAIIGYPAPDENKAGHDLTYQASLGLVEPPHLPRTLLADLGGAERAVQAALALLLARERGQGAGYQEVTLAEAAEALAAPWRYGLTVAGGLLGGGLPGYGLYPAREGWVAVAALEAHFLERLGQALGLKVVTAESLADAFGQRPAREWERWAAERDLPLVAVAMSGGRKG
jgi:crotonobetainyl-CoA:carnitine CoA-transferase CaiB-like acyl-CoA transferase